MAIESGNSPRKRRSSRPRIKYFYLNSDLHRVLRISNAEDLVTAWNYPRDERTTYVWSDARKRLGKAWTMAQVNAMLGRKSRVAIENMILRGDIATPQRMYTMPNKCPGKYFFSEKDVFALHDYLLTVHIGRPRKDGGITPANMPSKAELRAMMAHDTILYTKNGEGEFTPVWKEIDW